MQLAFAETRSGSPTSLAEVFFTLAVAATFENLLCQSFAVVQYSPFSCYNAPFRTQCNS